MSFNLPLTSPQLRSRQNNSFQARSQRLLCVLLLDNWHNPSTYQLNQYRFPRAHRIAATLLLIDIVATLQTAAPKDRQAVTRIEALAF